MKKQSFVKGAAILLVANAVSKILGAVFKIPLTYILGEEGMAIFNTAFSVYISILSFAAAGFPLALSKLISEEYALSHNGSVKQIMSTSVVLLSIFGAAGTAFMYIFAPQLAGTVSDPQAVYAIRAIAPSVFLTSLGIAYKSCCQGVRYMTPIGVSQVTEAALKLVCGCALAIYAARFALELSAAGAAAGISLGELSATAILIMMCAVPDADKTEKDGVLKRKEILKRIFSVALPMTAASAITGALSFADIALVRARLCRLVFDARCASIFMSNYAAHTPLFDSMPVTMRMTEDGARWLYGAYSGYTLTVFHLPTGIIGALCMGIFPAISAAAALGRHDAVKEGAETALRLTVILSLPCAVIMYLFPDDILYSLFKNCASAPMLRTLAPCVTIICAAQVCGTVLQGIGKIKLPLVYGIAASAAKPLIGWVLIGIPSLNICGAALSAGICCGFELICSVYFCRKYADMRPRVSDTLVKPFICSAVMGIVMLMCENKINSLISHDLAALAALCAIGGCAYLLALLLSGAVTKNDLARIRIKA